ncbi:nucleoside deaminase [Thalassobaculum sp.]|uniref:nucleoside deaminase n=1 Tax=Thalassobaculum sp. TaxID=2022740 RepID=UPI0032F00B3D
MSDETYLRRAIELSRGNAQAATGGPFGAVVVRDGAIVGEGANRVTTDFDPTAHAEVVAIRAACRRLGTYDLAGAVIYTSCEPCPMCLAAILWARIDRMVYANTRADAAAIGFDDAWFYEQVALPIDGRALPAQRLLGDEARAVFQLWAQNPDKIPY